jgi:hypothetical protein
LTVFLGRRSGEEISQRVRIFKKNDTRTLVNIGQNTTLCDSNVSEKFVQLLVIANGKLEVAGNDAGLFVVTSGVTSQFEDLCG